MNTQHTAGAGPGTHTALPELALGAAMVQPRSVLLRRRLLLVDGPVGPPKEVQLPQGFPVCLLFGTTSAAALEKARGLIGFASHPPTAFLRLCMLAGAVLAVGTACELLPLSGPLSQSQRHMRSRGGRGAASQGEEGR